MNENEANVSSPVPLVADKNLDFMQGHSSQMMKRKLSTDEMIDAPQKRKVGRPQKIDVQQLEEELEVTKDKISEDEKIKLESRISSARYRRNQNTRKNQNEKLEEEELEKYKYLTATHETLNEHMKFLHEIWEKLLFNS
jgi:putative cell wall-binding protein